MKKLTVSVVALLMSANAFAMTCHVYKPGATMKVEDKDRPFHLKATGKNIFLKLLDDQELEIIDDSQYVYLTINRPPTAEEAEHDQASGDSPKPVSVANFGVNRSGQTQRVDANLLGYVIQCSK